MVTLYVEGGGEGKDLPSQLRQAFRFFLEKAGLRGNLPKVVACGPRHSAYEKFCIAIENGEPAVLLVDSEALVHPDHQNGEPEKWKPWRHLKARPGDGWTKPPGSQDRDCHLMEVCMESWLISDPQALQDFFGDGFNPRALPAPAKPVETLEKSEIYASLKTATKDSKKGAYGKGAHSFKILAEVDPEKVLTAPWAKRFVEELKTR